MYGGRLGGASTVTVRGLVMGSGVINVGVGYE